MSSADSTVGDAWLSHAPALRALAAALTSDAAESEDLVQETWLRALRKGESTNRPRAWWSAVLRNLARNRAQQHWLREHTERAAAREERAPSEVEVLGRLEIAQRVTAELARLDEPYRTTIHLRYFEGLTPEQIASRLQAPFETVRARLRRGLALLRERMDRVCGGDRSTWGAALAAIAIHGKPIPIVRVGDSLTVLGGALMSMKVVLGVAAALVLGLGAYLLRPSPDSSSAQTEAAVAEASAPEFVAPPSSAIPAANAPATTERAPVSAAITAAPKEAEHGTIVVLDEHGAEHAKESGSLTLLLPPGVGKPGTYVEIAVTSGTWDPQALPEADCTVMNIVLGGREAILDGDRGLELIAKQPAALRARWLASVTLHVVDVASGAELDHVRLMRMDDYLNQGFVIPSETAAATPFLEDQQSPIALEPSALEKNGQAATLFACSHGHAWNSMLVDHTGGGDQYLRLEPGSDLTIALSGPAPSADTVMKLWKLDAGPRVLLAQRQLADAKPGPLTIRGLGAGKYEARVERGSKDEPKVLASATVTTVAGKDASLELSIPAMAPDEFANVVVVVRFDPSWDLEQFRVRITDLDRPSDAQGRYRMVSKTQMVEREPHVFASAPIQLRVARYQLFLLEANYGVHCDVTSASPQEVTFDIPARGHVIVSVKDEKTGALIERPGASFEYIGNQTSRAVGSVGIRSSGPGRVEFFTAQGAIRLTVSAGGFDPYLQETRELDVVAGDQDIVVELKQALSVGIVLREGDRPVNCPSSMMELKLANASGPIRAERVAMSSNGNLACFVKDHANYTLSFPVLAGYMPIPDMQVDLTSQDSINLVIQLVRQQ